MIKLEMFQAPEHSPLLLSDCDVRREKTHNKNFCKVY